MLYSEAAEGVATCTTCGFANFVRAKHCAMCNSNRELSVTSRSTIDHVCDRKLSLSLYQERQEWTRQVNAKNRVVWQRRLRKGSDQSPGYVLRFNLLRDAEPESEREVFRQRERSLSSGYNPCAGVQFELLESRDVDSTQFPLPPPCADTVDTMEDLMQIAVVLAAQDFPTKYAHFVRKAAMLPLDGETKEESCLVVHPEHILEQSVEHIKCIHETSIRSVRLQIKFAGEEDVSSNVGGLHREWSTLLNARLVDPHVGLFACTQRSAQTYFINPQSGFVLGADHLLYFYAAGRLVGRTLIEGAVLDFHLCEPLLKMILGTPIVFGDLEHLDAEMYQNLTHLLENDGAGALELDFTVTQRHADHVQTVELIPAGRNIQVNDDNKFEFADRKFRFMMFESVAPQLASFLKGFYEVVPQRLLLAFDYEELDYLLCGSDKIDVADWKQHTRLAMEYRREVAWFWDVIEHMSTVYRKQLLHFATGYPRVPLTGFEGLTSYDGQVCLFTLADAGARGCFRSHPCHNLLELPSFRTKDELRTALYAALYNESRVSDVTTGNNTSELLM
uniref:HECT-type E3 ubiquitin transferase n=1 Tax=Hyaloperonospora arabidopsidis (strain Emoy2) TaxID=559515 RepID=M4BD21_HYAAE